MCTIKVENATTVQCDYSKLPPDGSGGNGPGGLRGVIVVLLLLAAFGGGFWTGRATFPLTAADGCKFSVSKNGVIHNESCRYFGKNQARNCAFCGGLSGK